MRSFIGTSLGSVDSFKMVDGPLPEPSHGQVRLRIEATALGYVDGLMVQGRYQISPPLPYVPGGEIAGVVEAVGSGVTTCAIGDRMMTWQLGGGLAEQVIVEASDLDPIEDGIPSATAAAMLVDYQTAHFGLFDQGKLTASDRVLVLGAAGGVGSAAVNLAARSGAFVIAAASTDDKRSAAIAMGARETVDYQRAEWRSELKRRAPGGAIDVVFDPVGGDCFEPAFRSLAKEGRYLVVGFAGGRIPLLPVNLALLKSAMLIGVEIRHFLSVQPERARLIRQSLLWSVRTGVLQAPKICEFPLDEASSAIVATMSRERRGKVVVVQRS